MRTLSLPRQHQQCHKHISYVLVNTSKWDSMCCLISQFQDMVLAHQEAAPDWNSRWNKCTLRDKGKMHWTYLCLHFCCVLERALWELAVLCWAAQVRCDEGRLQEPLCASVPCQCGQVCVNMLPSEKNKTKKKSTWVSFYLLFFRLVPPDCVRKSWKQDLLQPVTSPILLPKHHILMFKAENKQKI